jgi:hypothetical protein
MLVSKKASMKIMGNSERDSERFPEVLRTRLRTLVRSPTSQLMRRFTREIADFAGL